MALAGNYEQSSAIIKIKIDGAWSVLDLVELLGKLDENYHALNSIFMFADLVDWEARNNQAEQREIRRDTMIQDIWYGVRQPIYGKLMSAETLSPGPPIEALVSLSRSLLPALSIQRIQYASPGWIELIGAWNPLKVLTDAIDNWRKQNTIRNKHENDFELRREKNKLDAENERLRIKGDILKAFLKQAPHLWSGGNTDRIVEVNDKVIGPAIKLVGEISRDRRISEVTVHAVGEGDKGI